jgi:hypothetical protein
MKQMSNLRGSYFLMATSFQRRRCSIMTSPSMLSFFDRILLKIVHTKNRMVWVDIL